MRRNWRTVDTEAVAQTIKQAMAPAMKGPPAKPFHPEKAAAEMAGRGIGRIEEHAPGPPQPHVGSLDALLAAWDKGWDQVKKELAPLRRTKHKPQKGLRWLTPEVKEAHKRRNKLRREMIRQQRDPDSTRAYQQAKREARRIFRQRKSGKISQMHSRTGPKEKWKVQNAITGRDIRSNTEPTCSADKINEVFLSKPRDIQAPLLKVPRPKLQKRE